MRPLFDEFINVFPSDRRGAIQYFLKNLWVLRLPEDQDQLQEAPKETTLIVIDRDETKFNPMEFFSLGFEHVLYSSRDDFASELFASCLMVIRPQNFRDNPIPFFFNGFSPKEGEQGSSKKNFARKFDSSLDKPYLINELDYFLSQEPSLKSVKDICLQSADEMISNAIYNAPISSHGVHLFKDTPRGEDVQLPFKTVAHVFATYSESKVVIGCEDPFGSIQRKDVLERLSQVYYKPQVDPHMKTAGTGLGFKFIIENAANFYLYCERQRKTLVASGFRLQGKKKNTSIEKHLHISVR